MKPTPETDSFITYAVRTDHNWRELARKLERERGDARAENEKMREAIHSANALLAAIGYAEEDATRSKLQPYITK